MYDISEISQENAFEYWIGMLHQNRFQPILCAVPTEGPKIMGGANSNPTQFEEVFVTNI